jgi:hypothetical protein
MRGSVVSRAEAGGFDHISPFVSMSALAGAFFAKGGWQRRTYRASFGKRLGSSRHCLQTLCQVAAKASFGGAKYRSILARAAEGFLAP